jgi:hypothetical protein
MRQDLSRRVLFIHLKKARKGTGLSQHALAAGLRELIRRRPPPPPPPSDTFILILIG